VFAAAAIRQSRPAPGALTAPQAAGAGAASVPQGDPPCPVAPCRAGL